jgi:Flp pilus assembly protein TadG
MMPSNLFQSVAGTARRAYTMLALRDNVGVAAIEFALYSTAVLIVLAGTVDLGRALYIEFQLDTAVNAGAQYVMNNAAEVGTAPSTLNSNTTSLVENLNGSGWATATVNVNNSNDTTGCYCPTGTSGNWSWGSSVSCGSTCSGGGVGGQFVTITANPTQSFTPLFPTSAFSFLRTGTISRSVLVETQ